MQHLTTAALVKELLNRSEHSNGLGFVPQHMLEALRKHLESLRSPPCSPE